MARFTQEQLYGPCFCGSGRKLKFCHAASPVSVPTTSPAGAVGVMSDEALVDRAAMLVAGNDFAAARALLAPRMAAHTPDVRVHNTFALLQLCDGDDDAGIATLRHVWRSLAPGNPYAGGLLAHALAACGVVDEANDVADRLVDAPLLANSHVAQVVNAFGVLGRDRDVVDAVVRGAPPLLDSCAIARAVALVNLSRLDEAGPALRKAITLAPGARWLRPLLHEVEKGRIPPATFGRHAVVALHSWLPGGNVQAVMTEAAQSTAGAQAALRRYPVLVHAWRQLVDEPGTSRELGLTLLARGGVKEDLLHFARGTVGDDDDRMRAATLLLEHGLQAPDTPIDLRVAGRVQSVTVRGGPVRARGSARNADESAPDDDDSADPYAVAPAWHDAYAAALDLERRGRSRDAEAALLALLKRAPGHPLLRFNLLVSRMRGQKRSASDAARSLEDLKRLVDDFPDYLFARATLAMLLVQAGRLDDAEAILPIERVTEGGEVGWIGQGLIARARIDLARDRPDAARSALATAAGLPGFDLVERAPDLALVHAAGQLTERGRARRQAADDRRRRRELSLHAPLTEWLAGNNVAQLKAIVRRFGGPVPTRREALLAAVDAAWKDPGVVTAQVADLPPSARAVLDELVAAGGSIAVDDLTRRHADDALSLLEARGFAVVAAFGGQPAMALLPPLRRALVGRSGLGLAPRVGENDGGDDGDGSDAGIFPDSDGALLPGEEAGLRAFFEGAAALYRRAPWRVVPDDGCLVRLRPQNTEEIVACVIGQLGEEHGIVLFDSVAACARWRACISAPVVDAWAPSAVSLTYEPAASLPAAIRAHVRALHLPLAGPAAFPIALRTGRALEPEPITGADLVRLTLAARVLALVIPDSLGAWPPVVTSDSVDVDGVPIAIAFAEVP